MEQLALTGVVDLGKQKKKKVNELKRGYGNLMEEVRRAVAQATDAQSEAIPVVVLFEAKRVMPVASILFVKWAISSIT